jgi:ABC-type multidrug transport system ATPase subunit
MPWRARRVLLPHRPRLVSTPKPELRDRESAIYLGSPDQNAADALRPPSHGGRVLSIEGLGRRFGGREVIESLSLTVEAGERVALRGPNGSGKTTVLRCVAGTVAPTRGSISVAGYSAGSVGARRLIGASLSQERSFYLRLSGHANLLCFARLRFESEAEAVEHVGALEQELAIEGFASRWAGTYSAGMLQQLAFARALLGEPALLLLDEPTRSLDEGAVERFWQALDRRPNAAVLVATHSRDDLGYCGDRIELPT